MNGKKQAVLCVLLSVMIGTSMFMLSTPTALTIEDENGYYVTLDISQYRDDVLIDRRVIEDDYILRNFVHMWLNMLSGERYIDAVTGYKTTDVDNVLRQAVSAKYYFQDTHAFIRIGTGSNPVAVTDYKLQTEVLNQIVDDVSIWYIGNQFNVTADTTIVSDGSYTITEAGINIGLFDNGGTSRHTLIARDVFAGISIINGDVIIIRYIFQFNEGL